ncbi:NAD(P)-dependent oxidoreductase [Rhizobium sp. SG_E_25_P2]|uniref:NAD(P)-dependent oxidoreductase n=1 Tax=Rhizobium sp. SG_E_25_P2 TaxID=2879942 RepID=UPI0024738830|nr:NAD(P)-dependent oxidoreductase [Rhizobium sp. SG_E_25_P2]
MYMRYAFIGLGHLGRNLASSLRRAGFDVVVNDIDPKCAETLIADGAEWAATPEEAARKSDAVITCLPSPKVSELVLTGETGILKGARSGQTWIEMSTLSSEDVERLSAIAARTGVRMMESPVTGGVHKAASGEITVIAGGDKDLFDLHRPALEAMGGDIFHAGPLGKAAVIKVITNMLAFIHLIATGEALMLAKRGGIDLTDAFNIIKASSGNSFVHETEGQVILNGSYNINFTMDLAIKDLGFALGFGKEFGVPLDLASHAMQTFIRAKSLYGGQAWSSQVVKLLEDATGTDLRAPGFPEEL